MELKKLVLLCQYKLHMKSTTSLYSKIQVSFCFFMYFVVTPKKKGKLQEI